MDFNQQAGAAPPANETIIEKTVFATKTWETSVISRHFLGTIVTIFFSNANVDNAVYINFDLCLY